MRVLVTGHRGYIGAHVVEAFRSAGHRVSGLDLGIYDGFECGPAAAPDEDLTADLFDLTPGVCRGMDAVVHLAAISNDPMGELDPRLTHRVNAEGTRHVAEAARGAGVPRFLFASSCSIYGAAGDRILAEDADLAPVSAYAESKIAAEAALRRLESPRFAVTCLRSATAFGFSPRLRMDLVANNLLGHALATNRVRLTSDGTAWRPLVHCRDIARAFLALAEARLQDIAGLTVNVGADDLNFQIRQVAQVVQRAVPGSEIASAERAAADPRSYRVSFERLGRVLRGFRLQHGLEDGVRAMAEELRGRPRFREEFESGRYARLSCLKRRAAAGGLPGYFGNLARPGGVMP